VIFLLSDRGALVKLLAKRKVFEKFSSLILETNLVVVAFDDRYKIPILKDISVVSSNYDFLSCFDNLGFCFLVIEILLTIAKEGLENEKLFSASKEFFSSRKRVKDAAVNFVSDILLSEGLVSPDTLLEIKTLSKTDLDGGEEIREKNVLKSLLDKFESVLDLKLSSKVLVA